MVEVRRITGLVERDGRRLRATVAMVHLVGDSKHVIFPSLLFLLYLTYQQLRICKSPHGALTTYYNLLHMSSH